MDKTIEKSKDATGEEKKKIEAKIEELNKKIKDMEEAENICDRVIMINKGIVIKQGTPKQIKEDTGTTNLRDAFFTMIGGGSDEE